MSGRAAAPGAGRRTRFFPEELAMPEGVFLPQEAEVLVFPYMRDHAEIFFGARVLDIGSGWGAIAFYAIHLGASRAVATDIDPRAVAAIGENGTRAAWASTGGRQ